MRNVVLITGLMGSGKSTVADILRQRGYEVLNMDKIAKDAIANELNARFCSFFGNDKFPKDVYFNPEYKDERVAFEGTLDNYLSARILHLLTYVNPDNKKPLFIEVPAMNYHRFKNFITKFENQIEYALLVTTTSENRYKRLTDRGMSVTQILERLELQSNDVPAVVHEVENNGTLVDLEERLTSMGYYGA